MIILPGRPETWVCCEDRENIPVKLCCAIPCKRGLCRHAVSVCLWVRRFCWSE